MLLATVSCFVFGETRPWTFRSSFSYITGDYGTNVDSDLIYIPFNLQRNYPDGRWLVTVPYIWIQSTADTGALHGAPVGASDDRESETTSGLGDVVVKFTYFALDPEKWGEWSPGLDVFTDIKIPTADKKKGLGTGEFDLSLGVGGYKWVNFQWIVFADWKYKFVGEPDGREYNNQIIYDFGFGRRISPDWMHSFLYEHRTAVSEFGNDSRSVIYSATYTWMRHTSLFGALEVGLSDGAPDYGISTGFSTRF